MSVSSREYDILRACTVNVNSVANKVNYINNLLLDEELDIMALSETWLTTSCSNSFIDIPGYSLCRGDVNGCVRKHGAALYISDRLNYVQVTVNLPNVAVVRLVDYNMHVLSIYRPPSYSTAENLALIEFISGFIPNKETILLGDFNLPSLKWSLDAVYGDYINPNDRMFLDCFLESGLTQWVNFGTFYPSGNILDLILSSDEDRIGEVFSVPPLPGCHHCPVICTIVFSFSVTNGEELLERRSWGKANFLGISEDITAIDWERSLENLNVQQAYNLFLDAVNRSIVQHVPLAGNMKNGRWMSVPPRALTVRRENQWKKYKHVRRTYGRHSNEAQSELEGYHELNHQYRNYTRNRQANYEQKLIDLLSDAPKLFHGYLRDRKKGCPSIGPLRDTAGNLVQTNWGMSEIFADAFSSVYVSGVPAHPHPYQTANAQMEDLTVSYEVIRKILENLAPSSSAGADGVHPSILHNCADVIALPLSIIIQKSITESQIPAEWKHSRVAPIFKAGSKYNALNYRPVSVTSAPCKVAERVLSNHVVTYLEDHGLLTERQFGFRKGRSAEDQLLLTYGKIVREVDCGLTVDAVYLDFAKAFDVLSHAVLLDKAEAIGFSPQVLGWVRAFLSNRVMQVSVGGVSSNPRAVQSGVPQGSVLGPLLFIMYVNSLGFDFCCEWYSFADDLKLFVSKSRQSTGSVEVSLQQDLDNLYRIATSWNLKLNPNKCVLIRFGSSLYREGDDSGYNLGGTSLKLVRTHRDLGVLIDSSLRFHPHIAETIRKSSGLANQLLRSTVCRSPNFMITLFISHIRPILDYCSTVWNLGYLGDVRKLESVQRRWTANVSGLEGLDYPTRLRRLNLFSIKGRHKRSDLIKVWKAFRSDVDIIGLFEREFHTSTRGHSYKLSVPLCHSEGLRRFFNARTVQEWNTLPATVVEALTLTTFKARLDAHMGLRFFEV